MNVIDALMSGTPVILPIIFTVLVSATTVAGVYAYRVNRQLNKRLAAKHNASQP